MSILGGFETSYMEARWQEDQLGYMSTTAAKIHIRNTKRSGGAGERTRTDFITNRDIRQRIAFQRKTQMIQLQSDVPIIQIEFLFSKPVEVTMVRLYLASQYYYAVCPNCGYAMEREYQQYCEVCGQCLAWNKFSRGEVKVQKIVGPERKERKIAKNKRCDRQHIAL